MRRCQGGYVLLQVMFVFAILVLIVAQIQYQQRLQIQRTSTAMLRSQAQVYAESAEAIAQAGLNLDSQTSTIDHLYELWNSPGTVFPLPEGGLVELELNDLQGRFNLNWLSAQNERRAASRSAFAKLLTLLDADPAVAEELYQWFDADSGADYYYADEDPSYAPSYTAMADLSELLLLKSVAFADYQALAPYLAALPADSGLNINTAPAEILQVIANNLSADWAADAVSRRGESGYRSVTDFLNDDIFQSADQSGLLLDNLGVTSQWFELFTAVSMDETRLTQRVVIYRDEFGRTTITLRDQAATEANRIPDDPAKLDLSVAAGEP